MKYCSPILRLIASLLVALNSTVTWSQEPPVPPPPVSAPDTSEAANPVEPPPGDEPESNERPSVRFDVRFGPDHDNNVQIGVSVHVKKDETVPNVVVIQASAKVDGTVEDDVVVIGGEAVINGHVRGDVVNVGSGIVLGPDAHIDGSAIGVLGGVQMGANSAVDGDVVGILGGVRKAPGAHVGGTTKNIALGDWTGMDGFSLPTWLKNTFSELLVKLRLLSLRVGWVWIVAGLFLVLYALLTVGAPGAVNSVVATLSERPVTTFLMGLLVLPLAALCSLILVATGVGVLVVPFLWAAVFFAGLIGKAGLLQFIGAALSRGAKHDVSPLVALLIGAVLVSLLYWIPYLGLLFWMTFALWALGAAVLALFGRYRKEAPAGVSAVPAAPVPFSPSSGIVPQSGGGGLALPLTPEPAGVELKAVVPESGTPIPPVSPAPIPAATPEVPDVLLLPRVGFRDRFLATVIDWVLLGMVLSWLHFHRLNYILALAYFVGFWVWRHTTIGGLLLRLRVARLDGRPVDVATALVRSLGALFGGLALGLGYFWSGWDPEKQGWHDKIAGTVIVKVPKTQPLV
ncbi:MAG TPA: RDD family protein [Verrucomicrobiota bacterium]|nr:RDD family protein [Verrucomicrobiota bacterium]